jgi:hypothetical protein
MSVFFQVLAALIVFAWLLGWAYERAQKQRERAIELSRQREIEREERELERENLRQWREIRDTAIALDRGTYMKAKWGRHLRPGDEIEDKTYDNYSKTTDQRFVTIIAPTGRINEDYPGHVKYVCMIVRDNISYERTEMWIDAEKLYDMIKYRADDIERDAAEQRTALSEEERQRKDVEVELEYQGIQAGREAEAKRRAGEVRAEYDAWVAARPTMWETQQYVRALARDWLFSEPDLPPPDKTHSPFVSTEASRALHNEEQARYEACLEIERRRAGLA